MAVKENCYLILVFLLKSDFLTMGFLTADGLAIFKILGWTSLFLFSFFFSFLILLHWGLKSCTLADTRSPLRAKLQVGAYDEKFCNDSKWANDLRHIWYRYFLLKEIFFSTKKMRSLFRWMIFLKPNSFNLLPFLWSERFRALQSPSFRARDSLVPLREVLCILVFLFLFKKVRWDIFHPLLKQRTRDFFEIFIHPTKQGTKESLIH